MLRACSRGLRHGGGAWHVLREAPCLAARDELQHLVLRAARVGGRGGLAFAVYGDVSGLDDVKLISGVALTDDHIPGLVTNLLFDFPTCKLEFSAQISFFKANNRKNTFGDWGIQKMNYPIYDFEM